LQKVIESYTFKFTYNENGGIDVFRHVLLKSCLFNLARTPHFATYRNEEKISSAKGESDTKMATMRLLRTIVLLTHTMQSLPPNIFMSMKLLYYSEGLSKVLLAFA
jgi:hypothetical protein